MVLVFAQDEFAQITDFVQAVGITGLLVIAILGGFRGWYVFKWVFDRMVAWYEAQLAEVRKDRDEWKAIALQSLEAAEKGVAVAERASDGRKS